MIWYKKFINILSSSKNFILKSTLKIALKYLFNIFILFNIVFKLRLNFKLKIDPKMRSFTNLEKNSKTWKNFLKKRDPVIKRILISASIDNW